jgi:TPR repeat protein
MKINSISIEKQEWNLEPDVTALELAATLRFHEAEIQYKLLAQRGSVLSMANLGNRYEFRNSKDGGPDLLLAEHRYQKSIDSGSAVATLPFGYFYLRRKDYENARRIFVIGAERNYAPAMTRLAYLYLYGIGVGLDESLAKTITARAAELGNLPAKHSLCLMNLNTCTTFLSSLRWALVTFLTMAQIYIEEKRNPGSERLKK